MPPAPAFRAPYVFLRRAARSCLCSAPPAAHDCKRRLLVGPCSSGLVAAQRTREASHGRSASKFQGRQARGRAASGSLARGGYPIFISRPSDILILTMSARGDKVGISESNVRSEPEKSLGTTSVEQPEH